MFVTALPIAAVATLVYLQDNSSWVFRKAAPPYVLDFGVQPQDSPRDLLTEFRHRYSGKFREFPAKGKPDPALVPFEFKFPSELPSGMRLKSVMIFDSRFCGSLGLVFSDGTRNLCLVQQPADRPVLFSGLNTTTDEFCKHNVTRSRVGEYSMIAWTAGHHPFCGLVESRSQSNRSDHCFLTLNSTRCLKFYPTVRYCFSSFSGRFRGVFRRRIRPRLCRSFD